MDEYVFQILVNKNILTDNELSIQQKVKPKLLNLYMNPKNFSLKLVFRITIINFTKIAIHYKIIICNIVIYILKI